MTRAVLLLGVLLVAIWLLRALLRGGPRAEMPWDPWAVLGVPRGAPREAITHAYRERMKEYHPDRVADLGVELQQVAHRRTVEIQRAYEELTAGR